MQGTAGVPRALLEGRVACPPLCLSREGALPAWPREAGQQVGSRPPGLLLVGRGGGSLSEARGRVRELEVSRRCAQGEDGPVSREAVAPEPGASVRTPAPHHCDPDTCHASELWKPHASHLQWGWSAGLSLQWDESTCCRFLQEALLALQPLMPTSAARSLPQTQTVPFGREPVVTVRGEGVG